VFFSYGASYQIICFIVFFRYFCVGHLAYYYEILCEISGFIAFVCPFYFTGIRPGCEEILLHRRFNFPYLWEGDREHLSHLRAASRIFGRCYPPAGLGPGASFCRDLGEVPLGLSVYQVAVGVVRASYDEPHD
jgi:hypothetical protein